MSETKKERVDMSLESVSSLQERLHREKIGAGFLGVKTAEVLIGQMGLANAHRFLAGIVFKIMSDDGLREAVLRVPFMQAKYDKDPLGVNAVEDMENSELVQINGHAIFLIEANTFYDLLKEEIEVIDMEWSEKDVGHLESVVRSVYDLISGSFNLGVEPNRSLLCLSYGSMESTISNPLSESAQNNFDIAVKAFLHVSSCLAEEQNVVPWLFKTERVIFGEETVNDYYLCRYNLLPVSDLGMEVSFSV